MPIDPATGQWTPALPTAQNFPGNTMNIPGNAGWFGGMQNMPQLQATGGIPQPMGGMPQGNQGAMAALLARGQQGGLNQLGSSMGQMGGQLDPAMMQRMQALQQLMGQRPPGGGPFSVNPMFNSLGPMGSPR